MVRRATVRDVMTREPVVLDASATVSDAARAMKERDVGDVLVRCHGKLLGIVTDRDLVVRALARDTGDAAHTPLSEVCTSEPHCLGPDADVREALLLMEARAIRRIPIVDESQPVGIVSLGDLAMALDRNLAARPDQRRAALPLMRTLSTNFRLLVRAGGSQPSTMGSLPYAGREGGG